MATGECSSETSEYLNVDGQTTVLRTDYTVIKCRKISWFGYVCMQTGYDVENNIP